MKMRLEEVVSFSFSFMYLLVKDKTFGGHYQYDGCISCS